jgi:hypothetical protein
MTQKISTLIEECRGTNADRNSICFAEAMNSEVIKPLVSVS